MLDSELRVHSRTGEIDSSVSLPQLVTVESEVIANFMWNFISYLTANTLCLLYKHHLVHAMWGKDLSLL